MKGVISIEQLEALFPMLAAAGYSLTSPATLDYNCIAWAAEDDGRWWEPDPWNNYFWPTKASRSYTITAYQEAYETIGYARCQDGSLEPGFQKIAIFSSFHGTPTHAARQLPTGKWTSKLGPNVDIEHGTPEAVEGNDYGKVAFFMKRPKPH